MHFFKLKKISSAILLIFFLVVVGLGLFAWQKSRNIEVIRASSTDNVHGFAWNDNIGWIGFNSEDYICVSSSTGVFKVPVVGDCDGVNAPNVSCGVDRFCVKQNRTCMKDRGVFCEGNNDCNFGNCDAGFCDNSVNNVACSNNIDCQNNSTCSAPVDFGVKVENLNDGTMGNFSGYAWSSNVGWISFDDSATLVTDIQPPLPLPYSTIAGADSNEGCNNCTPFNNCTACYNWYEGKIFGWAKIVSMANDGWIRFDGDPLYDVNVTQTRGSSTGWAWNGNSNGNGIGWVSFDCENNSECATSNYHVTFGVNRKPRISSAGVSSVACSGSAKNVSLSWTFVDDFGDEQTKYIIKIPSAPTPVDYTGYGEIFSYDVNDLQLGTSYPWTLTVHDLLNATSTEFAGTITTPSREYPKAYFSWHVPNPSAEELVLFTSSSSYATIADPGNLVPCVDGECIYLWSSDEPSDVITDATASSTQITFSGKKNSKITLQITAGPTCGTSTTMNIKNRLPDWIESAK